MNQTAPRAIASLRKLCEKNEALKEFLRSSYEEELKNPNAVVDSTETAFIVDRWLDDKAIVIEFGRRLEAAGFAKFIVGRHGRETRISWIRSFVEIANELFQADNAALQSSSQQFLRDEPSHDENLTVPDAKRLLAKSLGLSESAIEIIIRY